MGTYASVCNSIQNEFDSKGGMVSSSQQHIMISVLCAPSISLLSLSGNPNIGVLFTCRGCGSRMRVVPFFSVLVFVNVYWHPHAAGGLGNLL